METLRKSFRKSKRGISKTLGRPISGKSKRSFRKSLKTSLTTSPSEKLLLLGDSDTTELKQARVRKYQLFSPESGHEAVSHKSEVMVTIQGTGPNGKKRASLLNAKKSPGEIILGDGRLSLVLESAIFHFEMGDLANVSLFDEKAKEFVLAIKDVELIFFVKSEEANVTQQIVREIFVQARQQCLVFQRCITRILPAEWMKAIRDSSVLIEEEEIELKPLEDEERDMMDILMRELVDLTAFARGYVDLEYIQVAERFSKWLLRTDREQEAEYWVQLAARGKRIHDGTLQNELTENFDGTFLGQKLHKDNFVASIRNPDAQDFDAVAIFKNNSIPPNVESRIDRVFAMVKKAANEEATVEAADKYDDLI